MTGALRPRWSNRVALDGEWRTWRDLLEESAVHELGRGGRVAVVAGRAGDAWRALAAIVEADLDALIVGAERADDEVLRRVSEEGFCVWTAAGWGEPPEKTAPARPGHVTVVTSGTTGVPKLVPHTLDSLATMRGVTARPRTWLCPYAPGTYAWYQCALLGLFVDGQDVVAVDPADQEWPRVATALGVTAISATPTFWRRAFLTVDERVLRDLALEQVSLGGEPVPQSLLDRLHALYPGARLTHIYASSEAGACIVVSDGRAGFPREWVGRSGGGTEIAVEDGKLLVRSPWANEGAHGWIDTGDAVRVTEDRVEIVGREAGSIINVGGTKVSSAEIAAVLLDHPAVAWCRVAPKRAPIVGELPAAEVALVHGAHASEDDLIAWCRGRLAEVAVPRRVAFRDDVPATGALKSGG